MTVGRACFVVDRVPLRDDKRERGLIADVSVWLWMLWIECAEGWKLLHAGCLDGTAVLCRIG